MSCQFRIMDYNFAQDSTVTVSGTSEDASFPASNVQHPFRSKVWRSTGYFEITASNNKINFADSAGGPELTATIIVGSYTPLALAAQIALQMASAGAFTYTVTQSTSTGKWTIASSNTALELRAGTGTNIATGIWATIGFDASDYTGAITYTGPQIALHTAERLIIDLKTAEDVDSVALIFDKRIGMKLSEAAVVKVLANPTPYWTGPAVSQTLTFDQNTETFTHFFSATQTYRYWAIEIVDHRNSNLYVELSKVVLSKATQLDHGPEVGFKFQVDDLSKQSKTDYGHIYVDSYPGKSIFDFNLKLLPVADIYTLADIFDRVGNSVPIAIATDPLEAVFDKDRFFIYGYLNGNLKTQNVHYTYFEAALSIEEAL